ncbi:MAG: hypothetical protein DRZ82_03800 [Thermoprotei archaeon]|nr:MAG: hypothetical protein DRZ82_03800 [Thermoprotei archaeon]
MKKMVPKDVICYLFPSPDQDIVEIAISARIMPEPGVLARISRILAKHNIRILALNFSSRNERRFIIAFIDISKSDITLNELIDEIRNLGFVDDVLVKEKKVNKVIIDGLGYPMTSGCGEVDMILINRDSFSELISRLYEEWRDAGASFMFHQGKALGAGDARMFLRYLAGGVEKDAIREILNIILAYGWGIPEVVSLRDDVIVVRIYNSFEALRMKFKMGEPMCFFIKGYIIGLLSTLLGIEIADAEEIKCIAKGDEYCEFRIPLRGKY